VSASKGIYKCFGCGKAGNAITFVQEHEKMTYPEAIKWLAKRYHIEIEETQLSAEDKENQLVEESLRIINQFAVQYFHEYLLNSQEGKAIGLSYFRERGFKQHTIESFQLGFCPSDKLIFAQAAIEKGYKPDLLVKAGLVRKRNELYESLYAGRVIFPIQNQLGKPIGFGARILIADDKAPKYINTPENELYQKSKTLYGIYQAKSAIGQKDECLLVEGYTDVISLHQAGINNVVASSGTSLTEEQLKLIKRFSKKLTILYDGDAAGIKAALRGMDMAIEQGIHVQVVLLPDNHDPDSYIKEKGAEAFENYIAANKKDIILFRLEATLNEAKDDSVKKAALINDIAETISKINKLEDFTKQQDYIRRCAQLLQIEEAGLISLVNKKIRDKISKKTEYKEEAELLEKSAAPPQEHQQEADLLLQKDYQQEKNLVAVLIEYGNRPFDEQYSIAEYIRSKIDSSDFENDKWLRLYQLYFETLEKQLQYPELRYFTYHDEASIREAAIEAVHYPYELSKNWAARYQIDVLPKEMNFVNNANKSVLYFMLKKIKRTLMTLWEELKELQHDPEETAVIQTAWMEIKRSEQEMVKHLSTVLLVN
jgi:DNA primase, catalytic core